MRQFKFINEAPKIEGSDVIETRRYILYME
jgi:hypothetical protein